jgi:Tubulin-tyrosine ligase family
MSVSEQEQQDAVESKCMASSSSSPPQSNDTGNSAVNEAKEKRDPPEEGLKSIKEHQQNEENEAAKEEKEEKRLRLVIRGRYCKGELRFVRKVFCDSDFVEICRTSTQFDAAWAIRFSHDEFSQMKALQRVNYMPGTGSICRKDKLHDSLVEFKRKFGEESADFWPPGFRLPAQSAEFERWWRNAESRSLDTGFWILKPPFASCGRRIRLATCMEEVLDDGEDGAWLRKNVPLAQRYVEDPVLVDGFKCTLRIYVALTSMDPMRLYVYPEGLVRICSRRYTLDKASFADPFRHLDSIDVNEANVAHFEQSVDPTIANVEGLRMLVSQWAAWLADERGLDVADMWRQIHDIVVKSVASAEPCIAHWARKSVKKRHNAFDLFGYDILVDQQFKCWLLEINHTPSLSPHTKMENRVKIAMLRDLVRLVDYRAAGARRIGATVAHIYPHLVRVQRTQRARLAAKRTSLPRHFGLVQRITRSDLWVLVDTELERARSGPWVAVFPNANSIECIAYVLPNRNHLLIDWLRTDLQTSDFETWFD